MSAKDKRLAMAAKFEKTQRAMSSTVDDLALAKRSPVPYASTWMGESVSMKGPIPTDFHLIESNMVILRSDPPPFRASGKPSQNLHLSGKPWASYEKGEPSIYPGAATFTGIEKPYTHVPKPVDEEMNRARYMEWNLQKNAFNPDVAAAMRTNVRKMASLSVADPNSAPDPARTSENVRAALSHSDVTGPAFVPPKPKVKLSNAMPLRK